MKSILSLAPLFLAMAICYGVGEFYPLSSFPMYSKFDDRTYLVYLKDSQGEPLATISTISMPSSQLKKRYGAELDELKVQLKGSHFDWTAAHKREAGKRTLDYLRTTFSPQAFENGRLKGVQLIDERIFRIDGQLKVIEEPIATVE